MSIHIHCNGTNIRCVHSEPITVHMSGAPVQFTFSEEWDGLGKTAVFRCDGSKDVIVGADGTATVPHEILTTPGLTVEVGVYTQKEDGTTWPSPTPMCEIGIVREGADPTGDESYPPTPDVGEQLLNKINFLGERVDRLEENGGGGSGGGGGGSCMAVAYVQPDEPEDLPIGGLWYDTDEEPEEAPASGVTSVNGKTGAVVLNATDVGALPKETQIPTVPTNVSAFTNDAGYAKTSEIPVVPAALPNPNKLTFTGAVSAEYDGSEAVSVEIPAGGDGDETLVYAEEQLATGTIASDSTGQKLTNVFETGLTLGDLKQWKSFVFKLRGAANADPGTSYLRLMNTNYANDYNSISFVRSTLSGTCAVFEWADTARTVLKVVSGFIGTNSYVAEIGGAFASNTNSGWTIVPVNSAVALWVDLRNCADTQVLAVTKSPAATDYLWEIRGLVK